MDLYSATAKWNVVRSYRDLPDGTHTLQIVVLGTHNASSTGNRVVIDAFSGPISADTTNVPVPAIPDDQEEDSSWTPLAGFGGLVSLSGLAGLADLLWLRHG